MVFAVNAQRDRDRALNVRPVRNSCDRAALPDNAVRVRRYARRNDCCCRSTSRGQKKRPAGGIWRARLWILVSHRASVRAGRLTQQRVAVHTFAWKTKAGKTVRWAPRDFSGRLTLKLDKWPHCPVTRLSKAVRFDLHAFTHYRTDEA